MNAISRSGVTQLGTWLAELVRIVVTAPAAPAALLAVRFMPGNANSPAIMAAAATPIERRTIPPPLAPTRTRFDKRATAPNSA
jgi:hypothetical protein